jgi:hypothetical protein
MLSEMDIVPQVITDKEISKKRFIDLLMDIKINSTLGNSNQVNLNAENSNPNPGPIVDQIVDGDLIHNFFSDPDAITKDMFVIGEINLPYLIIDIAGAVHMDLNLTFILRKSIAQRKMKFINLLFDMNIDIFKLEPIIMPATASLLRDDINSSVNSNQVKLSVNSNQVKLSVNSNQVNHDFVCNLLHKFIDMKIPIYENNYACIYILAAMGKIDMLEKIMKTYAFNNFTEIIGKICVVAVRSDQVNVLEFFMPVKTFDTIPDIIFQYFIKGIECGDNINVIKYLTSDCIQISQENYLSVKTALKFKRRRILEYFIESDPKVIEQLNLSEIKEFCPNK